MKQLKGIIKISHQLMVEAHEAPAIGLQAEEIARQRRIEERSEEMATWVMGLVPEWQAFATLTFPWEAGLQSTINSYERFMRKGLPSVNHFYAVERNPSRAGHHVHAIWSQSGDINRKDAWQKWFDRYGRARIEPVRHRQNVVDYCAKYIIKDQDWFNVKIVDGHVLRCIQEGRSPQFQQPTLAKQT